MKILFAGALLGIAAVIANVSLAEEAPVPVVAEPDDGLSAASQPCVEAGPAESAVAAMMPSGVHVETGLPLECPLDGQGDAGADPAPAVAGVEPVVAQPILVGPPPRNLTGRRIYRS